MKSIQFLGKRVLWVLGWFFLTALAMASESVTYYHNDVAGTPVLATDASGAVIWKETYLPYGKKQTNAAASANNRIGFTGKPYDSATGLSYMGARYYDPLVGRFNGIDPNGFEEKNVHSFNRYAYANNNPYKFVDPDGRIAETVWDVANVAMDVASLAGNLAVGNYGAAAVDGLGLLIDGVATAVPFVPGGAGMAIKTARGVDAAKEGKTLFHYTDAAGAKGIAESGVIQADAKGRVFLTEQKLSPAEVKDRLFIGRSGDKGSHVVEIQSAEGLAIRQGKNANELIHQGSIRDGRQGTLTVKPNE